MDLPTYTNIWRIEKRLYKLYDFRLPMPLPVGQIAVFAAIAVPYVVILKMVGLPFSHTLLWLYILPPGALAWLVTRPVLEGKRLPELVVSQVRYLNEPRTWCRMAPLAERDEIVVIARVWRRVNGEVVVASPAGVRQPRRLSPQPQRLSRQPQRVRWCPSLRLPWKSLRSGLRSSGTCRPVPCRPGHSRPLRRLPARRASPRLAPSPPRRCGRPRSPSPPGPCPRPPRRPARPLISPRPAPSPPRAARETPPPSPPGPSPHLPRRRPRRPARGPW